MRYEKIVSARAAEIFWIGEVQGVTVDVQDHVAIGVANDRIQVCGSIIEQPQGFVICFVGALVLGCSVGTEGDKYGDVDGDRIVEESSKDLLKTGGRYLAEARGSRQDFPRTGLWRHRRDTSRHGWNLVRVWGEDAGTCAVLHQCSLS